MPLELNKIIQGLWIGSELSVMEQLSISSFIRNGRSFPYGFDFGSRVILLPGTSVLLAVPIRFSFTFQKSTDRKKIENYGTEADQFEKVADETDGR